MTDGIFQSTLRDWRSCFTKRPVLVGMLALGVLLGISGPFDTLRIIPMAPLRIVYWVVVVVLTFATGSLASVFVHTAMKYRSKWLNILISTCVIGTAVTIVLSVLNLIAFDIWPSTWIELLNQFLIVTLISAVVEIGSFALGAGSPTQNETAVALMQRLPWEKRGPLVSLSAEDHYVRVTTANGTKLVLIRLSDAIKEVGDTRGMQIHRSHWVALDQIQKVERSGDRGKVTMKDESSCPISRKYMPDVRAAGLLPNGPTPKPKSRLRV
ncbi:MAG: LytTR family DNA-binding domain-containing protein [Ascidiaceihabitans sp.]|nr:LytTR family DNA-binding domain-containing protein [Ascidiaceihabitans sp.]